MTLMMMTKKKKSVLLTERSNQVRAGWGVYMLYNTAGKIGMLGAVRVKMEEKGNIAKRVAQIFFRINCISSRCCPENEMYRYVKSKISRINR